MGDKIGYLFDLMNTQVGQISSKISMLENMTMANSEEEPIVGALRRELINCRADMKVDRSYLEEILREKQAQEEPDKTFPGGGTVDTL